MDRKKVYEILSKLEKNSLVRLEWDRGNGKLDELFRFGGFDKNNNPLLYINNDTLLDIKAIGGYNSFNSIKREYLDQDC
ncbi:hypothetical protein M0R19_06845 [Candidatus Pacearchaeota archaeon]|nr:hypothetical protein [Candidatus Pacearchaeota archaeon]